MDTDQIFIQRCLQLAAQGLGTTYPNPMVGSVIVHQGKIIGEGWHYKAGMPHAEVNAVASVKDKSLLKDSTIYVSLEPCSHFGKTPPCADLIIAHQIPRVVIATIDPFAKVCGQGVQKLKAAGIEVVVGCLEQQANELNKRFFTYHQKQRPYIILKWAQTIDGFIAPSNRTEQAPVWITSPYARQIVHKWRSEEQAILIGTQTALADNPRLDTRDWSGNSPIRVVIDRDLRIPKSYHLWDDSCKTIVITAQNEVVSTAMTTIESIDFTQEVEQQILEVLYKHQIQSVIIEGGAKVLQNFIDKQLWDEARVFTGKTYFRSGVKAPILNQQPSHIQLIESDELTYYYNKSK